MENAHLRFGLLEYVRITEKASILVGRMASAR
jgi:hypothetical protein